jgi:protein HIRA/HIR1
MVLLLTPV